MKHAVIYLASMVMIGGANAQMANPLVAPPKMSAASLVPPPPPVMPAPQPQMMPGMVDLRETNVPPSKSLRDKFRAATVVAILDSSVVLRLTPLQAIVQGVGTTGATSGQSNHPPGVMPGMGQDANANDVTPPLMLTIDEGESTDIEGEQIRATIDKSGRVTLAVMEKNEYVTFFSGKVGSTYRQAYAPNPVATIERPDVSYRNALHPKVSNQISGASLQTTAGNSAPTPSLGGIK